MAMSDLLRYFGTVGVNPFAARTATIPPEIEQQQAARQIKDITGIDVYKPPPLPMPEIDLLSLPQRKGQASLTPTIIGEEQGPPRPTSLMPQEIDIAGLPQRRERAPVAPVAPKRDSERLGLMLYALGGALRGDKDFVSKTIQLREMKEGKKKEAERKKNFDEFLVKAEKEGTLPQTTIDLARMVGAERGASLILGSFEKDKKTAAQMNLQAYKKIAQTGTPEEIEIAERVLIGSRAGKSIEQLRNETVANLSKSTNPITGEPLTTEEVKERLKIFDDLIASSTETPSVKNASDMSFDGYNVVEVKR